MIRVNRLNRQPFYLNPELIESIEETPDTVITLINGKTVMVANNIREVVRRIIRYRQKIHALSGRSLTKSEKVANVDLKT